MSEESNLDNLDCGFQAMMDEHRVGSVVNPPAYHQVILYPMRVLISDSGWPEACYYEKKISSFGAGVDTSWKLPSETNEGPGLLYGEFYLFSLWLGIAEMTSAVNISYDFWMDESMALYEYRHRAGTPGLHCFAMEVKHMGWTRNHDYALFLHLTAVWICWSEWLCSWSPSLSGQ